MNAPLDDLFILICARGCVRIRGLRKYSLKRCKLADEEHRQSHRQYMHMNHKKNVICYASAAEGLDLEWKIGLIAHELGHAAAEAIGLFEKHSEEDANKLGSAILESRVQFKGPEKLEWATPPPWLVKELSAWPAGRLSGKRS